MTYIDLPPLKGAVYIHHCNDDTVCYEPAPDDYLYYQFVTLGVSIEELENEVVTFMSKTSVPGPHQRTEIAYNEFDNNQAFPLMSSEQVEKQGACIYIIQGNNIIHDNTFKGHRNNLNP